MNMLENETYKILWDFDTQTDQPIPARRPDLIFYQLTKSYHIVDFVFQRP